MIDKTAIIHASATIAENVSIGAYSVIGEGVRIDEGTRIGPHVVINGPTTIGKNNQIFQFASIGDAPQDKSYADERTYLEIGDDNVIRECVTINRGTSGGAGVTRIGNDNLFMAYAHVAHDCQLKDHIIMANSVGIAGHVSVDNWVIMSGFCGVHQFCQIGAHCFISHASLITKDVPPYVMVVGGASNVTACGINSEGLKRRGFSIETISILRRAYKILYRQGLRVTEAMEKLEEMAGESEAIIPLIQFLKSSKRGILR